MKNKPEIVQVNHYNVENSFIKSTEKEFKEMVRKAINEYYKNL
jgi:hypothetical protein